MEIQSIAPRGLTEVTGTTPTTMTSPAPTPSLDGTLAGISQQLQMSDGDSDRSGGFSADSDRDSGRTGGFSALA